MDEFKILGLIRYFITFYLALKILHSSKYNVKKVCPYGVLRWLCVILLFGLNTYLMVNLNEADGFSLMNMFNSILLIIGMNGMLYFMNFFAWINKEG